MKLLAFLNILIFTFFIASCTGDKEVMAVLERAERYLPDYPDSAETMLQSISTRPLRESGERARSLYGVLRTMTDAMEGKGVTTDSLIRPSYIYYKEQSGTDENVRRLGRSAFYLAQFEASRDSTKRAEDLFREAIRCSEKVEDWRTCYMAYNHFAKSITWSNSELAIELRKQAINIYNRCKDKPENLISILNFLSNDYIAAGFADSAFRCAEDAYQIALNGQLENKISSSLRTLSNLYFATGNYQKALELAKQGMHDLTDQTRDASLFSLADCYLACDSLEPAKTVLSSIHSSNPKMQYAVCRKLSHIALIEHDTQLAMTYSDSLETATVSMFTNIQQTKDAYYQDNLKKELHNMQLTQGKRQQAIVLWGTIILIVVISVFIVIIINKNRRIAVQKRINTILLRRREQKAHAMAITELEQELNEKTKQVIDQQIISDNQISMEKNEKEKVLQQYKNLQKQFARFILRDTDLLQKINPEKQVQPLTPDEWEQLAVVINQKSNNSIINLHNDFPELSNTDIKICMLTLLGLSNSQIADVLERTSSAIKKRKHNIKTAIFGVQDTNIYFEFILRQLCS
ncbi:MAG: hypothetical protein J5770_07140 [Bacteroidaceae bacterium]|nr:hypothetical protein [Bacteroidaceae bacterium]